MKKYFSNKSFLAGFSILAFLLIFLITGSIFNCHRYDEIDTLNKFAHFSSEHLFGTDHLGRDVFSRILVSLRISFSTGFIVMVSGLITGIILGAFSGFFGGICDSIITKIIDTQMSFPGILISLMLIAVFGNTVEITITALYIMTIPRFTRIARSGFIKYKNSMFVTAAKSKGAGYMRILFVHILPNIMPDLTVTATLNFSLSILAESGLSYLGLGIQPPLVSFGRMLNEGQRFILQSPSNVLIPAAFLILLVLSLNLMGDGISEVNKK